MKVLICIPYHEKKRYSLGPLMDWVRDADLGDAEVIMRFHTGVYGEDNGIKNQREYFRKLVLAGDFTHLLFVGADTIPPLDVLPRLAAHNAPIMGGVYKGRHGADNGIPDQPVAWRHLPGDKAWSFLSEGGVQEIDGMGMDCVLISREVLEQISWLDWVINDDDYPFWDAAKRLGYKILIDTTILCRHYSSEGVYSI